jgi:hypothetical protein
LMFSNHMMALSIRQWAGGSFKITLLFFEEDKFFQVGLEVSVRPVWRCLCVHRKLRGELADGVE